MTWHPKDPLHGLRSEILDLFENLEGCVDVHQDLESPPCIARLSGRPTTRTAPPEVYADPVAYAEHRRETWRASKARARAEDLEGTRARERAAKKLARDRKKREAA